MEIELVPGGLWNIIGSIAIIAFGVAVAMVKPRGRPQVWFLAFAVSFGAGSGLSNINIPDPQLLHDVVWFGVFLGYAVAPIAVAGLVLSYAGRPESPSSWWATMVPAAVILAFVAAAFIVDPSGPSMAAEAADIDASEWLDAAFAAFFLYHASILTGGFVLSLWARRGDDSRVRQAALLSSALVLYTGWVGGSYSLIPSPFMRIGVAGIFLGLMLLSAFWLSVAARGVGGPAARNAALIPLAAGLAGLLLNLETAPWTLGLSRILMTAILAYAIVRHKAFGIDAKLRFGISKGSIAAVFVAVFFFVSEAAQEWFGQETGNEYYGIAAAGLLVLSIQPLQRVADRLAEKAVPLAEGTGSIRLRATEAAYVSALRAAARDGVFTRREERHLADAAEHLGIGPKRALELREHVEAEA